MLIPTLENLLNRGLPRSPRAQALCGELAGSRLVIEAEGLPPLTLESDGVALRLRMGAVGTGAEAAPAGAGDAPGNALRSARLRGGPFSLLSLAGFGAAPASAVGTGFSDSALQRGAATITGDAAVAEQYRELLQLLRPDPEEELALLIGDVPAHGAGRLVRAALRFGTRAADTTLRNLGEFLAHESRDLVSAPEGRALFGDVDVLREGVDRLEARISRLSRPPAPHP